MNDIIKQPKPKRRFTIERDILDAIEALQKKAGEHEKRAKEFDGLKKNAAEHAAKADAEGTLGGEFWRDQMQEFKLKAEKSRLSAGNIRDKRLKALQDKLAEFQTEPMMFLGCDNSIQA
jgi:hypothetical protein